MVSEDSLISLCRGLAAAVRSGLPLSGALEGFARSGRHGRPVTAAAKLAAGGSPLHEAFAAQRAFPPVFTALLRAGEEGGKTADFLELYAGCLEARVRTRRQLERMLVYPLAAMLLAAALFLLASLKAAPLVLEPLLSSGASLPPGAFFFTTLADRLAANWHIIAASAALGLLALRAFLLSGPGRKALGLAGHLLPLFRFASAELRFYYIYTTIALLMKAGLGPQAMMDVLLQFAADDLVTRGRLRRAAVNLAGGGGLAASLQPVLSPPDMGQIETAEKAGRLDDTLLNRAGFHYDAHAHRLELLVKAFNLSMLAFAGAACLALVLAVIWPALAVLRAAPEQALPVPEPIEAPVTLPPDPLNARTSEFNARHGRRAAELMSGGGAGAAEEAPASRPDKKITPVPPLRAITLERKQPAAVQPSNIPGP